MRPSGAPELAETTAPPAAREHDPLATVVSATPPWESAGPTGRDAGDPPRIGRFVVLREIGRGAMGVVYAGYDDELDRRVALKLVQTGSHDDPSLGRAQLLREAQALARLIHPNVVAVHEAGEFHGAVFIAMEYVDGVDLQHWLAHKPRSWREVVAALRQAGEGLRAAHDVGLIHRDFKPSNVLVGADGRVRVADFGLATRRGRTGASGHVSGTMSSSTSPALVTLAGSGALVGTPAYMAPEQLRREPATAASDQFAFCVTLWEALYGRRPFAGDTLESLAEDVLRGQLSPVPPDPRVPAWLHALLLRGLAGDPARRFPGLGELLDALAHDPEAERQRRRQRLRQIAVAVAATVVVVLGGVAATRAIVRAAHERRAEARLDGLREQSAQLTAAGKRDEAARLFAAFVALPDNRGTAALAAAFREWGDAQTDPAAAIDAHAGAYIAARTADNQAAALRSLAMRLADSGAFAESAAALAALDARAPELAGDPELAGLRVAAALDRRDLPAARAALDRLPAGDPKKTYGHVLEHLSTGAAIPRTAIGHSVTAPHVFDLGDLDGDGRPELVTASDLRGSAMVLRADAALTRVAEVPLKPQVVAPRLLPPALADVPLLLLGTPNPDGAGDSTIRYGLYPTTGGPPVYEWTDSKVIGSTVADLTGTGHFALYTGSGPYARKLRRIDRDPAGAWRSGSAHPPTDAVASDIHTVAAGDVDGDGRPELVVVTGPWTAYDVRVLKAGDDGELRQLARRSFGFIETIALLRSGSELRIAAAKRDVYDNPGRFSEAAPFGEPAGVYVLAVVGETLEIRQFFPLGGPDKGDAARQLHAADLDGDGTQDLLAEAPSQLTLYRGGDDGLLEPIELPGLALLAAAEFDDDREAELLVRASGHPDDYLILGAGDVALSQVPRPAPAARPIRPDLDDPAIADAWQHAEELAAIGLPGRSAAELATIARLSGHAHEDMLLRAAELYAAAGDHAAAAEHYLAAAGRPDLAEVALAGAIRSRRALGEFADAQQLAARRAALPGLDLRVRNEAEAELAALRRATAERPRLGLRFDRPLDPAWRIGDPLAFARRGGASSLSLQTSTDPVIAEYPLEWDGGTVAIAVEAAFEQLEWGTALTIALMAPDSDDVYLGVRFEARERSERPLQQIAAATGPNGGELYHALQPGPGRRVRIEFTHYPDLGVLRVEARQGDGEPVRSLNAISLKTPPRGPLRLRVLNKPVQLDSTSLVDVFAVDLVGLRAGGPLPPAGADDWREVARLIAEEEIDPALQRLAGVPAASAPELWRIDLLARAGRIDEAATALRGALTGLAEDHPFHARLRQRLMRDPDNFVLAAKDALGPALYDILLDFQRREYTWSPARVRFHLTDLAALPLAPPAKAGPEALQHHRHALLLRGLAWQRAGRDDLAVRDLEAVVPLFVDEPEVVRMYVLRRLLESSIRLRDPKRARRWITAALTESHAGEILLETIRKRPGVEALFTPADWDRFEAVARR
ncbi:serine/threonine-protein kinase [Nannocystis radixulma]|uniref:Protein kinase n=1 Tax=Nannocystis radixulma TaxID=2995305 RepID=A0ABT5BMT3_9BACT|nr:serine/threonine-protein kinase [Nannocystis radixulma]MDC0675480.1 protein kinase [Nannocystis radixulma]